MTNQPRKLEFLTTAEVAAKLDVEPARIGQLVAEGKLKVAARIGKRTQLFRPSDVERLKEERISNLIQKVARLRST